MPSHAFSRKIRRAVLPLALLTASAARAIELPPVDVPVETPIAKRKTSEKEPPGPGTLIVTENAYASLTVVPRSDIELEQYKTLGDALFNRPGLSGTTYAPLAANRPIIRGLDNFRVRIQENGSNVGDVSALGEDHPVPIDPLASQQIEVIRGPATLRYGSEAAGGVVSAANNRIPAFIPENGFSATSLTGVLSVDRGIDHVSEFDAGAENFAVHADIFARAGQNYAIPGGEQPNSAANRQGVSLGGSYICQGGYAGAAFSNFDTVYHIPGGAQAESLTRIHAVQDKVMGKGEVNSSSDLINAFRFWLVASDYRHEEIGIGEDGVDGIQTVFKAKEQELRAEIQQTPVITPLGGLNGAAGVQAGNRAISTSGAETLLLPSVRRSLAAYLFEELSLTAMTRVQAAGRIEYVNAGGTAGLFPANFLPPPESPAINPMVRTFLPLSASLGLQQDLPYDMAVSLSGLYSQRAPGTAELFSLGPHDATGTFEIGDPNLSPEISKTAELGLRRAAGPLRFDTSLYYTFFNGFIYKRLTGITCGGDFASCGMGTELQQAVYAQQNAVFFGGELGLQYDVVPLGPGFAGVELQYDYVRARFTNGTNVPRIPPMRVGGGIYYRDGDWYARTGILHAFAQNLTAPFETPTAGYDNLQMELAFRQKLSPGLGFAQVSAGISGDNLLNEQMRNSASFKKDQILLPGRGVRAHLTLTF
jgi:iron complex outermembrane receptor protein